MNPQTHPFNPLTSCFATRGKFSYPPSLNKTDRPFAMFEENLEKNYVSVLHREETVEINKIKYFGQALTTLKHS